MNPVRAPSRGKVADPIRHFVPMATRGPHCLRWKGYWAMFQRSWGFAFLNQAQWTRKSLAKAPFRRQRLSTRNKSLNQPLIPRRMSPECPGYIFNYSENSRPKKDGQTLKGLDAVKTRSSSAICSFTATGIHSREALAALLWGDKLTEKSKKYLRQSLWHLQTVLESDEQDRFCPSCRTRLVETQSAMRSLAQM